MSGVILIVQYEYQCLNVTLLSRLYKEPTEGNHLKLCIAEFDPTLRLFYSRVALLPASYNVVLGES